MVIVQMIKFRKFKSGTIVLSNIQSIFKFFYSSPKCHLLCCFFFFQNTRSCIAFGCHVSFVALEYISLLFRVRELVFWLITCKLFWRKKKALGVSRWLLARKPNCPGKRNFFCFNFEKFGWVLVYWLSKIYNAARLGKH